MGKKKYSVPPHKCRLGKESKGFSQIFNDLLDSDAFHDLSPKQKTLYLYCEREAHGSATKDDPGKDKCRFYMNRALRTEKHGLYPKTDTRGFERDMAALIDHGFVDCIESNYKSRRKNVYRLSARWKSWGTSCFKVDDSVKTNYMKIRAAKETRADAGRA